MRGGTLQGCIVEGWPAGILGGREAGVRAAGQQKRTVKVGSNPLPHHTVV